MPVTMPPTLPDLMPSMKPDTPDTKPTPIKKLLALFTASSPLLFSSFAIFSGRTARHYYVSYEEEVILRFFEIPTDETPPEKIVRMNSTEIIDYLADKTSIPLTPQKVGRVMSKLKLENKSSSSDIDNYKRYSLIKITN